MLAPISRIVGVAVFALACSVPSMASAQTLDVTMYLVPASTICPSEVPFADCIDVEQYGMDNFLDLLFEHDSHPLHFKIPSNINLRADQDSHAILVQVTEYSLNYRESPDETTAIAAVFFVDLPKGTKNNVSLRKKNSKGGFARPSREVITPGRYVTWINATDIDPSLSTKFEINLSGTRLPFRFIS